MVGAEFSVSPGSIGAGLTAVFSESGGVGFADELADIYISGLVGTNALAWEGDGVASPGAPGGANAPGHSPASALRPAAS